MDRMRSHRSGVFALFSNGVSTTSWSSCGSKQASVLACAALVLCFIVLSRSAEHEPVRLKLDAVDGPLLPPLCVVVEGHRADVLRRWSDANVPAVCPSFGANFPSLGGPGCPCPCEINDSMSSATVYWADAHTWPDELTRYAMAAVEVLRGFGPLLTTDALRLHLALSYHCCVGKRMWPVIKQVADSFPWRRIPVSFAPLVCAVSGLPDTVSLVLPVDAGSSQALEEEAARYEAALAAQRVAHVPHSRLQPHHITLATVNATLFRVADAVAAVHAEVSVGGLQLELSRPRCHRCDTLVERQRKKKGGK